MKVNKTTASILYALLGLLFTSFACSSANIPFLATPTPTNTLTPTPSSTPTITPSPTFTPSPTPLPLPDVSRAILTLADLPKGFEIISTQPPASKTESYYSFANAKNFQLMFGAATAIMNNEERISFDLMLNNPDTLIEALAFQSNDAKFTNILPISGLDSYGEASAGFIADTDLQGVKVVAEFFIMRNKNLGVFLMNFHRPSKPAVISIEELARILDGKVVEIVK